MHIHPVDFFEDKHFRINPKLCFVLMPFTEKWSNRVYRVIKEIVEDLGFECKRADEYYGKVVLSDIWQALNEAAFVISDLTEANPNVYYELGLSHTLGKDIIPLLQNGSTIPFDQQPFRILFYEDNSDGDALLKERLPIWIKNLEHSSSPQLLLKKEAIDRFNIWRNGNSYVQLSGEDFSNLNLSNAHLNGIYFTESIFSSSIIENANLNNSILIRANLENVSFANSTFVESNLSESNLENANFTNADLSRAILLRVNINGTNFQKANVEGMTIDNETFNKFMHYLKKADNFDKLVIESG